MRSLSFSKQFVFGNVRMQSVRFNFRLLYDSCVIDVALCSCHYVSQCRLTGRLVIRAHHRQRQCGQSIVFISQFHIYTLLFSFFFFCCHLSLRCPIAWRVFSFIECSSRKFRTTRTLAHKNAHFVQLKSHDFSFLSPASLYLCPAGIVDACSVHTKHLYVFNSQRFLRYFRCS